MQNEPNASQCWESCKFTLEEQKNFLENFLCDALKDKPTKILVWDHNKVNLWNVANTLLISHEKIVGLAVHSYQGTHTTNLSLTKEK